MAKKFLRRIWSRYSKLGKRRKKKQKWKNPTGRDNQMRLKRKGYPRVVSSGYSNDKKDRNKINGKTPLWIYNVRDLEKLGKENIGIVASVGKKKKTEIAKKANEMKIEIYNMNTKKILKENKKWI